ncbi:MAG: Hsp33 family molecular chaperone HslO [Eubacteriales bacterium]|nr:Hsp33 family molecular chaperone HslO [Eubacteriales bacterium]
MRENIIFPDPDALLRLTLMGRQARAFMIRSTRMAQQASDIHQASDVAAAAIGRLLPGCAMLGGLLKGENGRLTVTVDGDGPGGRLHCGVKDGKFKIAVQNPQVQLPLTPDGRQDVGGFVGNKGKLIVVKDYSSGDPYTSVSDLVSGELGEDLASYFTISEQTPSLVALGCLNEAGTVLSSGGILIQAMPGCSDGTLRQLELRIPFFANISREIFDRSLKELAEGWFRDLDPEFLGEEPLVLRCDCSREKMRRALAAIGREELEEIVEIGEETHLTCHFCRTERSFSVDEVEKMLADSEESYDTH